MASFFDYLLLPDHRLAALKVKDYVVSLESSIAEKQLAASLGVGLHQFIGERNCLLIGITSSAFSLYSAETGNVKVSMANNFYMDMLQEFFSTRPGMAKSDGLAILANARRTYYIEEPKQLGTKFLTNIADGMLASEPLTKFPELQQYIHVVVRDALLLVQQQAVKMMKSNQ